MICNQPGKFMNELIPNFGDLTKPATVLIEKISDAIGGIYKPYQIRKVAEAEAQAKIINAKADIEITQLQARAMQRFFTEEAKKQHNIETITSKALPLINDNAPTEKVEDDWITDFFDKCRLISDDKMQTLWSKVLVGEANAPGKFSKKAIDLLSLMDKKDAESFSTVCRFAANLGDPTLMIYNTKDSFYRQNGINYSTIMHMESMGLVQQNTLTSFNRELKKSRGYVIYFSERLWVDLSELDPPVFDVGQVVFTHAGFELYSVCEPLPIPGFLDFIKQLWLKRNYTVFDKAPDKFKNS